MYQYEATVTRVIDGDTVVLDVDLGFGLHMTGQSFRLLGLNAREHNQEGGVQATSHLMSVLPAGSAVRILSVKPDKFGGRYDAAIMLPDGTDLTMQLIEQGWAAAWNGQGEKPLPPWPRQAG